MPGHLLQEPTEHIRTLIAEVPGSAAGPVPDLAQKLIAAADYLRAAQEDIQLNVLPPISVEHASAIENLLRGVTQLLMMDVVRGVLPAHPVTGEDPISGGWHLLDEVGGYKSIATFFFSKAVEDVRVSRTFEEVVKETDLIVGRAKDLKRSVVEYIGNVRDAFGRSNAMPVTPSDP